MPLLAPPPPPPHPTLVAAGDDDRRKRLEMRLYQILTSTLTVFLTAWFCTFGAISAICAIMIAKHVLVAILMMGIGVDAREPAPTDGPS
jgi:hypothetical protein